MKFTGVKYVVTRRPGNCTLSPRRLSPTFDVTYACLSCQEPITRNLRATSPYSCHGVFTDRSIFSLNLSRIQIPTGTSATYCNYKHGLMLTCRHVPVRPHCFILTEACSSRLEWYISREKYLKIDWSVKMPLQAPSNGLLFLFIFYHKCFASRRFPLHILNSTVLIYLYNTFVLALA